MTKQYSVGYFSEEVDKFIPTRQSYRTLEEAEEEAKDTGFVVLERNVSKWREHKTPIDYSVTKEMLEGRQHVAGQLASGYIKHAYKLTPELASKLLERGSGYYISLREARTSTLCNQRGVWSSRIRVYVEDISELENTRKRQIGHSDKFWNSICPQCQKAALKLALKAK